jgi:tetratricopeptide (TPR) repeat protein
MVIKTNRKIEKKNWEKNRCYFYSSNNTHSIAAAFMASSIKSDRLPYTRTIQNYLLIWLDGSIDVKNNEDCRNTIDKLRQVMNTVEIFTRQDECIDFINNIKEVKIFMICSGALGQITVPLVHNKQQVNAIYIFCGNKTRHEQWIQQWSKVQGVYTDITAICETLKQGAKDCDQNMASISFVKTTEKVANQNLDELDPSFMYTQILKEILITIEFKQEHMNEFLTYCREQLVGNTIEVENVDKIEKEYHHHQPIWWYTFDCFLYSMLNRALRTMEVDTIIKMGFFVRDLHQHIVALHSTQYGRRHYLDSFKVYRGQGLSQTDFDQLLKTKGGLFSFNNFLSTSKDRDVSFKFAQKTIATSSLVGILFVIKIDPTLTGTPFANVQDVSAYQTEKEILFSMHSVFRIGQMEQIEGNNRLWQVKLTLTGDNDPQLYDLTKRMREETKGSTGWLRLGKFMIKLAHYDKAEYLFEILLAQRTNYHEKGDIFYQLGLIKLHQGKYTKAIEFYESALKIRQETLPSLHTDVAECYNDIGVVYYNMEEYSKALSSHEKSLKIYENIRPPNYPDLATSYSCHGSVYCKMGEYSKALYYYEKALTSYQKNLPSNHPDLATLYNNIAVVYENMKEYSKALSFYEKALEIRQRTLPQNHPDFAYSYNNIALVYKTLGEYPKALSFYERALNIFHNSLPSNHPNIKTVQNNIEILKKKL